METERADLWKMQSKSIEQDTQLYANTKPTNKLNDMFIPAYSSLQTPYSLRGHKSRFHHSSRYPSRGYLPIRGFKAVDTFELRRIAILWTLKRSLECLPFFFSFFFYYLVIFLFVEPNLNIGGKSSRIFHDSKSSCTRFEYFVNAINEIFVLELTFYLCSWKFTTFSLLFYYNGIFIFNLTRW